MEIKVGQRVVKIWKSEDTNGKSESKNANEEQKSEKCSSNRKMKGSEVKSALQNGESALQKVKVLFKVSTELLKTGKGLSKTGSELFGTGIVTSKPGISPRLGGDGREKRWETGSGRAFDTNGHKLRRIFEQENPTRGRETGFTRINANQHEFKKPNAGSRRGNEAEDDPADCADWRG